MDAANRAAEKIRKCMAIAGDVRGDPTTRDTARRQADALRRKHFGEPIQERLSTPAAVTDWSQRSSSEAAAADLRQSVMCKDGVYVPARP